MSDEIQRLQQDLPGDSGPGRVAYRHRPPKASGPGTNAKPNLLFCGGFHSNMDGGKAQFLDAKCAETGLGFTRFDYRGHGHSDGTFKDGTIGDWYADAKLIFETVAAGPQIVIGSSMGAWMALMLARDFADRVAGLILIAPAPDFPRRLMLPSLPDAARTALAQKGIWHRPSEFEDDAYPITQRLIDESAAHELLDGPKVHLNGPVHILHGTDDEVVPLSHAKRVPSILVAPEVSLIEIPKGDHRLSSPPDLDRLWNTVRAVTKTVS